MKFQECNHGRTNETRDRLRKRLHQIHNKSSTKGLSGKTMKNQPGALKKMLASKVTAGNCSAGSSSTQGFDIIPPKQPAKPIAENIESSTNEVVDTASSDNSSKIISTSNAKGACSKSTTNNPITANSTINPTDPKYAKKRKILSCVKGDNQHANDCDSDMCKSCDGKSKHRSESNSVSNSDADSVTTGRSKSAHAHIDESTTASTNYSIDDILDFIEGNNTNKKDSQKKAAKKAKQKQRKEDVKRIEELEQLRDQFHEAFFKELDVKSDLKNLRSMKKRDKKKIAELETSIKKYGKFKSKIESNILELIGVLKSNNTDFKFAYLPTKEQQLEKQQQQLSQSNSPVIAELIGK